MVSESKMRALADRGAPPLSDSKRPLITLTGIAARQFSPDAVIKRGHRPVGRTHECYAIPAAADGDAAAGGAHVLVGLVLRPRDTLEKAENATVGNAKLLIFRDLESAARNFSVFP